MNYCVYGASSAAIAKSYINPTEELGQKLAAHGHGIVFGGGANGLMGAIARGVHRGGGKITGVSPTFFKVDGILYEHCDEMIYTETMRERKKIMEDSSDGFIITPGGPGTLDEFFEILTLKQLGRHTKPIAIFNIHGYYDPLLQQLESSVDKLFLAPAAMKLFGVFDNVDKLIRYMEEYEQQPISPLQLKYLNLDR